LKKLPRFFCDNCSYEVDHQVKACPHCGRYFASVRCPVCDFSGLDKMFLNGCPLCGYSAPPVPKTSMIKPPKQKKRRSKEPNLPLTYIVAFVVLIAAIFLLSYVITR
jgi:hypothetical protein